jgi:REP-associated tyrosine transposase
LVIPKYRRKVFYGRLRRRIGPILRELCRQRGVELVEGHAMPDHVHLCLSIPPKYRVAHTIGFLKGIEPQESNARGNGSSEAWNKFRRKS